VEEVERVNRFATGGLLPDLTILLWLDPDAAAARAGEADRFEDEGVELQRAVYRAYEELAAADPGRWRRIDADRPPDEIHADVLAAVQAARAVRV
jgi:dTMP kinase